MPEIENAIAKDLGESEISGEEAVENDIVVYMMNSSRSNEVSYEFYGLEQSVFSYYLLKGLEKDADVNADNNITLEELFYYVKNNTTEYVEENYDDTSQNPVLFGRFRRKMIIRQY